MDVVTGVPKGCLLGPLVFIICTADMFSIIVRESDSVLCVIVRLSRSAFG